jgi:hypothetical protein
VYEEPVSDTSSRPPLSRDVNALEYLACIGEGGQESPSGRVGGGKPKLNSNSVRLCNNQLFSLQGLDRMLVHLLDNPSEMVWLDASCNQLTNIEDIVLKFPLLQV